MAIKALAKSTLFTLKMYRLYWTSVLTVTVILPLTYMAILVLSSGGSSESLVVGLTGYLVMVCFSSLVYPVALIVANTFEEQVLELHASLPISLTALFASYVVSQLIFSAPAITLGIVALYAVVGSFNWPYIILCLFISLTLFPHLAILLGLTVKSRYKLEPVLTSLITLVVVATPLYYRLTSIYEPWRSALLLNPITHVISLLRLGTGIHEGIPTIYSIVYLGSLTLLLSTITLYKIRHGGLTALEKR